MNKYKLIPTIILPLLFLAPAAFSQEEVEYKKFKLEDSSCDVGIRYKKMPNGMMLGVSAIATGKGVEFRKWKISVIKIDIEGARYRPDDESEFYVTKESLFRVPGAIVFAAIGAFGEYGGSDLNNTMSKIGVGLGMGLLVLQAKGEITGERAIFKIPHDTADKIEESRDYIEISIENEDLHLKNAIKIGLIKPTGEAMEAFNYEKMTKKELLKLMNGLKGEIVSLEKEQADYKYGEDPQFDEIQHKIDKLETQRGMAYKAWFDRR